MANLNEAKADLIEKIDDLFGFNIQNRTDGISYDFGQYRLNKLYRPLVKYFIDEFMEAIKEYPDQDAKKIIGFFTDFFSIYYSNGDFGYFKNRFSSHEYRIPYTGSDTEFRWATKDCYYVKTSDVVNNMSVNVGGLLGDKEVQIKMYKKTDETITDTGDSKYNFDIVIEDIVDEDSKEPVGYSIYFINTEEAKININSSTFTNKISEVLNSKGIDYKNTPILKKLIEDFLKKRGRDYFIHKRLKDFLTEELEWYFFQLLKNDIQSKSGILEIRNKIEEIKAKYSDDPEVVNFKIGQLMKESNPEIKGNIYQEAYIWIENYINIIADLEEFKAKLWNKKRKITEQNYCINLKTFLDVFKGDTKVFYDKLNQEIINNDLYRKSIETVLKEKYRNIDMKSSVIVDNIEYNNGCFNLTYARIKEIDNKIKIENNIVYSLNKNGEGKVIGNLISYFEKDSKNYCKFSIDDEDKKAIKYDNVLLYKEKISIYDSPEEIFLDTGLIKSESIVKDVIEYSTRINLDGYFIKSDNDQALKWMKDAGIVADLVWIDPPFNTDNDQFIYKDSYKDSSWLTMMYDRIQSSLPILSNKGSFYLHLDENADYLGRLLLNSSNLIFRNEIIAKHFGGRMNVNKGIYEAVHDTILFYTKGEDYTFNYILTEGEGEEKYKWMTTVYDKYITTKYSQFNYKENAFGFKVGETTQKTEDYLQKYIRVSSNKNDSVIDFFAGTGTTCSVAHKLGRKWIGINIDDTFERIFLNRMRKVLIGDMAGVSKETDVLWKGGGLFKYIRLNQYEDWFNDGGYLDSLKEEISELSNKTIESTNDIKEILYPLNNLKDRIYHLDD